MAPPGLVVELVQELVLGLGIALAGANAFALFQSRRAATRYEREFEEWRATRKLKDKERRHPKPDEPRKARPTAAIVNIAIGLGIALMAVASLTFGWVG